MTQLHSFVETSFGKPISCNHCSKLLWGVSKQGLQCEGCQTVIHKRCEQFLVAETCDLSFVSIQSFDDDLLDQDDVPLYSPPAVQQSNISIAAKNATSKNQLTVVPVKNATLLSRSLPTSPTSSSRSGDTKRTPGSLVQDLMATTVYNQIQQKKNSKVPSLNLLTTTPKNFSRFVSKIGPVFAFQESVEKVINWDSPTVTLLAMISWTVLCLHPVLLCIFPQLILLSKISNNYYFKARNLAASAHSKKNVTATDSVHHRKNMQNIQNSMGMYCDVHDNLVVQARVLDWSNEEVTSSLVKRLVASIPVALVVSWIIPWNYAILAAGLMPLIANTALVRASATTLAPYFTERIRVNVDKAKEVIANHISPEVPGRE